MKKAIILLILALGCSLAYCKTTTALADNDTSSNICLFPKEIHWQINTTNNDTANIILYTYDTYQSKRDTLGVFNIMMDVITSNGYGEDSTVTSKLPIVLSVAILILLIAILVIQLFKKTPRQYCNRITPTDDSNLSNELEKLGFKSFKDISNLKQEYKKLLDELEEDKSTIENWKMSVGYDNPKDAKKAIDNLKRSSKTLDQTNEEYEDLLQIIKNNPQTLKGNKKYSKLSSIIERAEDLDRIMDNPDLIDKNSKTGQIIKKGYDFNRYLETPLTILNASEYKSTNLANNLEKSKLFDDIKNDVSLIINDSNGEFADTDLKNLLGFVYNPEKIANTKYNDTGLYKLISSINNLSTKYGANTDNITYEWLKKHLAFIIENANRYLDIVSIANYYGTKNMDTSKLDGNVKEIFDNAVKYLQFGAYKEYWKNMSDQLLPALNDLHNNDDIYNTRLLLFYASQLLSISCIMSKIHGDYRLSTTRFEANVSVFNVEKPTPHTEYGIPVSKVNLNEYLFEYKGDSNEDHKIEFLKKYKPLPFVFINSYFSDSILK